MTGAAEEMAALDEEDEEEEEEEEADAESKEGLLARPVERGVNNAYVGTGEGTTRRDGAAPAVALKLAGRNVSLATVQQADPGT